MRVGIFLDLELALGRRSLLIYISQGIVAKNAQCRCSLEYELW